MMKTLKQKLVSMQVRRSKRRNGGYNPQMDSYIFNPPPENLKRPEKPTPAPPPKKY